MRLIHEEDLLSTASDELIGQERETAVAEIHTTRDEIDGDPTVEQKKSPAYAMKIMLAILGNTILNY